MLVTDQGGPQDHAVARRRIGLAAAQGDADAQFQLAVLHASGEGGPQDHAEARRLLGLAAAQGHADAQVELGTMHANGQGGPQDHAEARRLYGLAAAEGHAEARRILEKLARASADALLAEEEEERTKALKAKSRKGKGKGGVKQASISGSTIGLEASKQTQRDGQVVDGRVSTASESTRAADEALEAAMTEGTYEALAAALETHGASASEPVCAQARATRNTLKERRKKQSQRQRKARAEAPSVTVDEQELWKSRDVLGEAVEEQEQRRAHAGAMAAVVALQAAQHQPNAAALQAALSLAARHTGALSILEDEAAAAQAMLASMTIAQVAETPKALELTLDVLAAATDGFADSHVVGEGGFGKVYAASTLVALPTARHHSRVAVKRAHAGLELQDVRKEVEILQACEHLHLLPLYGFCFDSVAPCLVRQ